MKYNLYIYELLGNEDDGFEVNDIYLNTSNIELDDRDLETDDSLFAALKKQDLVNDTVSIDKLNLDWQEDANGNFTIYIDYDGKPACELRPIY